jgi:hypothetical protein
MVCGLNCNYIENEGQIGSERFKVRGNTVWMFKNYPNIVKPESRRDRWYSCPEGPYRFCLCKPGVYTHYSFFYKYTLFPVN